MKDNDEKEVETLKEESESKILVFNNKKKVILAMKKIVKNLIIH